MNGVGSDCGACAFRFDGWTAHDAARTVAHVDEWWSRTLVGLDAAALGLAEAVVRSRDDAAAATARLADADVPGALPLVHAVVHAIHLGGRAVAALGHGAPTHTGAVEQLNTSGGGVPKLPVPEVRIGWRGLEGDRQAARKHHGRPWQAVSLWSADVIDAIRDEGHPLAYGSAGENVTVRGVEWATLRTGTILAIGGVVAEVSLHAIPCRKNAQWFLGGDFWRMGIDREVGVTRWYAWVRRPGTVRPGDEVVVEP